jgi:hypothetical protein
LDLHASDLFNNFTRMSNAHFEFLINVIWPKVTKKNTNFRESISVLVRLVFLSSGESYHYDFKYQPHSQVYITNN